MTVIKRIQQNYNYPNSNNASDTESLHLGSVSASDSESINNEPIHRPIIPLNIKLNQVEELVNIKKSSGKKKIRRYQNRCILQTLVEDDENENSIAVIMEPYKSPLARLLEDRSALKYWNSFIEKSEEEQNQIMSEFNKKRNHADENKSDCEKPFGRISSKIRRTIKIRKNLSLEDVKNSEDELINFFKATPNGIYIKHPPTSFDRLLLHGIAQYHKLNSISHLNSDSIRIVKIYNASDDWNPAECFLTDFIILLRK